MNDQSNISLLEMAHLALRVRAEGGCPIIVILPQSFDLNIIPGWKGRMSSPSAFQHPSRPPSCSTITSSARMNSPPADAFAAQCTGFGEHPSRALTLECEVARDQEDPGCGELPVQPVPGQCLRNHVSGQSRSAGVRVPHGETGCDLHPRQPGGGIRFSTPVLTLKVFWADPGTSHSSESELLRKSV